MGVIFILLGISLSLGTVFLVLFVRAMRAGQYDDTVTPAMRMLADDEVAPAAAQARKGTKRCPKTM